jgi:hypothetical protein
MLETGLYNLYTQEEIDEIRAIISKMSVMEIIDAALSAYESEAA